MKSVACCGLRLPEGDLYRYAGAERLRYPREERLRLWCPLVRDRGQPIDVTGLGRAWDIAWPGCPPAARRLAHRFPGWAVRFHTLPEGKRYATSESEHAEILRRQHALLAVLSAGPGPESGALIAVTCSWSGTPQPAPRDRAVASTTPEAVHWRSDDLATEPGFHSWEHHYASEVGLRDPALDLLLLCVADDLTDGVLLTNGTCGWVFHPYDGGAVVFTADAEARDRLSVACADWLASDANSW
jgi:hypothetical protein